MTSAHIKIVAPAMPNRMAATVNCPGPLRLILMATVLAPNMKHSAPAAKIAPSGMFSVVLPLPSDIKMPLPIPRFSSQKGQRLKLAHRVIKFNPF